METKVMTLTKIRHRDRLRPARHHLQTLMDHRKKMKIRRMRMMMKMKPRKAF